MGQRLEFGWGSPRAAQAAMSCMERAREGLGKQARPPPPLPFPHLFIHGLPAPTRAPQATFPVRLFVLKGFSSRFPNLAALSLFLSFSLSLPTPSLATYIPFLCPSPLSLSLFSRALFLSLSRLTPLLAAGTPACWRVHRSGKRHAARSSGGARRRRSRGGGRRWWRQPRGLAARGGGARGRWRCGRRRRRRRRGSRQR